MINCPRCGSRSVPIAYGLILTSVEAERGELVLGGCCIIEGLDPDRQCTSC